MTALFNRPHHQRIAQALSALNGPLLRKNNCLFGGGTVVALLYGEFRESFDIDFLVSVVASYRELRQLLTGNRGIAAIVREDAEPLIQLREVRADQYGIRTSLEINKMPIKFEIVLEGRIALAAPDPNKLLCGIATLTLLDMATSKLLANSDRWADDGVFNRDVIDLAMMAPSLPLLREAAAKAGAAYGNAVLVDLGRAVDRIQNRHGWMERCMQAMDMQLPKALLWQRIRSLRKAIR